MSSRERNLLSYKSASDVLEHALQNFDDFIDQNHSKSGRYLLWLNRHIGSEITVRCAVFHCYLQILYWLVVRIGLFMLLDYDDNAEEPGVGGSLRRAKKVL